MLQCACGLYLRCNELFKQRRAGNHIKNKHQILTKTHPLSLQIVLMVSVYCNQSSLQHLWLKPISSFRVFQLNCDHIVRERTVCDERVEIRVIGQQGYEYLRLSNQGQWIKSQPQSMRDVHRSGIFLTGPGHLPLGFDTNFLHSTIYKTLGETISTLLSANFRFKTHAGQISSA